ncbi:hypothetical protein RvY_15925 [Ramazzottius varieornatus]|uniref:Uncharacterized protein n=1 Tax=Ramazzottius varieornatus TaxID=947166 RepID=A0A1D1VWM4_RAMVA|nr:hypothetical protein RvY_15925 [Ramazzottius varieornatus]
MAVEAEEDRGGLADPNREVPADQVVDLVVDLAVDLVVARNAPDKCAVPVLGEVAGDPAVLDVAAILRE